MSKPEAAGDHRQRLHAALEAIETLQARLDSVERAALEPIAIVGIGCRFPGGIDGAESFWSVLREGRDVVAEVPADRWDINAYYDPDPGAPGKIITRDAGCLADIDMFDPLFFALSPKEAAAMDPQQRLALEVATEAFDDAGIPDRVLKGSTTGVFLGLTESEYAWLQHENLSAADSYTSTGLYGGIAANRISYLFDLKGPSFTVDSICSSSLLAVHLAVDSLRRGECTLALAGGTCVLTGPDQMIWLSKLGTVSPRGRCRAFSADADGIVLGEGCGFVVLKPLARAVADRDRVYALVRGSGVSQDGRSNGLTAPSRSGQEAMLRQAYARAGIAPSAVHYVDAHGTGTALGDPIEAAALGAVLGAGRDPGRPCYLGSAKTNLAHLGPVGGIASLIKTALALHYRELPASLHFSQPNPHIPFADLKLRVADRLLPWPYAPEPAVAGVSSLAFGGTNVHVVLSEADRTSAVAAPDTKPGNQIWLVPISAASTEALSALARSYTGALAERDDLLELAASAARRRSHHAFRMALVGPDGAALAAAAQAGADGRRTDGVHVGMVPLSGEPRIAFVFSGHGAQHPRMCRDLLATSAVFRQSLQQSDAAIMRAVGWSVLDVLAAQDGGERLQRMDVAQPVLFAVQVGLAAFWRSLGIEPSAVIGSSMGEIAAAHVAGHLARDDAVRIVCERSRLLQQQSGRGAMGFVELAADAARQAILPYRNRLAVAVVNGPRSCVLSGDPEALDAVFARLEEHEVFCQRVNVTIASQSPHMDDLRQPLRARLGTVAPREGEIPLCSTVDARYVDGLELDTDYWIRNLREMVRLGDGIACLATDGCEIFLEMSPHPLVLPAVAEVLRAGGRRGVGLASLHREEADWTTALNTLAELFVRGCDPKWEMLFPSAPPARLPRYPWQRQRLWLDPPPATAIARRRAVADEHPLLGARHQSAAHPDEAVWDLALDPAKTPWLAEHRVEGRVVLAAAASLDLVLSAVRSIDARSWRLANVRFVRPIEIDGGAAVETQLLLQRSGADGFTFAVHGRAAGAADGWQLHVRGEIEIAAATAQTFAGLGAVADAPAEAFDSAQHYAQLAKRGGEYGPAFRRLVDLRLDDREAVGRIEPDKDANLRARRHAIDPILLDASMQVALALLPEPGVRVPVGVERFNLLSSPPAGASLLGRARLRHGDHDNATLAFDIDIVAAGWGPVARLEGLTFTLTRPVRGRGGAPYDVVPCHVVRWEPLLEPAMPAPPGGGWSWLILADAGGVADALAGLLRGMGHRCDLVRAGARYAETDGELTIDPADPVHFERLLGGRFGDEARPLRRIVHAWSLNGGPAASVIVRDCGSLLHLVQALGREPASEGSRLVVLTSGAQQVVDGEPCDPAPAALWGLGRSIALEQPERRCRLIDLPPQAQPDCVAEILPWLVADDAEYQIAWRGSTCLGARLTKVPMPTTPASPAAGRPFRLEQGEPGRLETLRLVVVGPRAMGARQVRIRVQAAALNFVDVLRALGALRFDDEPAALHFGMECVGEVTAVGEDVGHVKVGDRVVAVTPEPGCLATEIMVPSVLVVAAPVQPVDALSCAPIAYLTAWHALFDVARLATGDRVLVHAATGGVGLAAVAIAQRLGALVFATAGSEAKRDHLRSLGISHVYDSRSLAFAEEIRRDTEGRGVDVVLNSLAGAAMQRSFELLAPFGRFVEIGKRDQQNGGELDLRSFARSLSYASIDISRLLRERPDASRRLLDRVVAAVAGGALPGLPHTEFPIADAERAFRTFGRAEHIGRIVLSFQNVDALAVWSDEAWPALRADASYLVSGGLGGLGLRLAEWLAQQGARHLTLVGRRQPDAAAQTALAAIRATGAAVETCVADVADEAAMTALVARLAASPWPIRGIFHLAASGDDGLLEDLTWSRFETALRPKIAGALLLDRLSAGMPLDHFVLFSSTAAVLGAAGQANYAAANAFLDALAASRRARGVPGLSIAWGPWGSIGGAASRDALDRFDRRGLAPMAPRHAFAALSHLLAAAPPRLMVAYFDAERWAQFHPGPVRTFVAGGVAPRGTSGADLVVRLGGLAADRRRAALLDHLRQEVAAVLGVPRARLDPDAVSIAALGIDSLMSLELRTRLESSLGLKLSATLVFNYATFPALADYLLRRLGLAARGPGAMPTPAAVSVDAPQIDVDALSDAAAEAMLRERLDGIEATE